MRRTKVLGLFVGLTLLVGTMSHVFTNNVNTIANASGNYGVMRDISATELEKEMVVGWNLGNTFDAHGGGANDETFWGNPKTTKEMIDAVKTQGFNTIRIPVTWTEHVGNAPDYKIDANWISRVEEVVNYALADDMYVILDTHHDVNTWLVPNGNKAVNTEFTAIWKQVANHFKSYGDHLLFEGMNEVRTIGSENEWKGGTKEERAVIDTLNSDFVNTVRATGGNNEKRCLIISPYGNAALENAMADLDIPAGDKHLMVAIHAYTPYAFTYHPLSDWEKYTWDGSAKSEIETVMKLANTYFVSKGIPVIITEFGAVSKQIADSDGTKRQNTSEVINWLNDYLYYANQYGIKCVWWDNGFYVESEKPTNEVFGIFNRNNLTWYQKEVADYVVRFAKGEYIQPIETKTVNAYSSSKNNWGAATKTDIGSTATYQALWQDSAINLKVTVKDTKQNSTDKIVIYLDKKMLKDLTAPEAGSVITVKRTYRCVKETKTGYEAILSIPMNSIHIGASIGFDIAIIDNQKQISWNDTTNAQACMTKNYGKMVFKPYTEIAKGTAKIDGSTDEWTKLKEDPLSILSNTSNTTGNGWKDTSLFGTIKLVGSNGNKMDKK